MNRLCCTILLLTGLSAAVSAQFPGFVEGELIVADRGNVSSGSDGAIRRYTHTGTLMQTLPSNGTGQIRGVTLDAAGRVYVARGDAVRRYTAGTYQIDPSFVVSGIKAQDVAYNPATDTIWCSFGAVASEARIIEASPTNGAVLQNLTDASLVHPRSIAFDYDGEFLFIANGTGGNIIRLNVTTTLPTFQNLITLSSGMVMFNAIGITVDADDVVYAVSDWGAAQTIVRVTGTPGMAMVSLFLTYSMAVGIRAPAGCYADTYGNIYFACRNDNMSTDGVYGFSTANMLPSIVPMTGMEHINPIDIAFLPEPFSITLTSPDGTDANGVAIANASDAQPNVMIRINAPNFPGRAYGILLSLFPTGVTCAAGNPVRPMPGDGIILALGEPRRLPLVADFLLAQSFNAVTSGGSVPFIVPPFLPNGTPVCPGTTPGTMTFFSGVTDAAGRGTAFFTLPTLPCLPVGAEIEMAIAGAVTDAGQTLPLGIGAMANVATCLKVRH